MKEDLKAIGKYFGGMYAAALAGGVLTGLAVVAIEDHLGDDCTRGIINIVNRIEDKMKK